MRSVIRLAVLAASLALGAPAALWAQPAAAADPAAPPAAAVAAPDAAAVKGPPAGFVAPAEPSTDESNGVRSRTQPGNNAPIWRAARDTGTTPGYASLPGAEKGVLIQPFVQYPGSRLASAGEAWRQVRNRWILPYGGALLVIALLTLGITYWKVGPFGGPTKNTGRVIERFTPYERALHWATAISFAVLGISGLVMAFGKFFMLPVIGGTLFGWLTYALKTAHNFVGPLFAVSLVLFSAKYLADNLPRAGDLGWLVKFGGMFGGHHVPSHRFNAGEKIVFWAGGILLGLTVVASGLVLDALVPGWGETRGQMQIAHMVHAVASILMMALFFGHIYMGVFGIHGAMDAMKTGFVDEAWAKEHHELWYDDVKAGRIPAVRSQTSPPAIGGATPQA